MLMKMRTMMMKMRSMMMMMWMMMVMTKISGFRASFSPNFDLP